MIKTWKVYALENKTEKLGEFEASDDLSADELVVKAKESIYELHSLKCFRIKR